MRSKLLCCCIVFSAALSLNNAQAALWNVNVGDVYTFDGIDSAGNTWENTLTVTDSYSSSSGEFYYKVLSNNYENEGETSSWYLYSNDTSIYTSSNQIDWDLFINRTYAAGSSWTITEDDGDIVQRIMHGYNINLGGYSMEQFKIDKNGTRLSPSDNYLIVYGLGLVAEVDYWVDDNAPYTQTRTDWAHPSAVPTPNTLLLLGAGLLGLVRVRRKLY